MQVMEPDGAHSASAASGRASPGDVLLVEDDPLIALDVEDTLKQFGIASVRSAARVAEALVLLEGGGPALALLNVKLGDETSAAIVERLDALGVPLAFLTGYGARAAHPQWFADRPKVDKPYTANTLEALLRTFKAN